MPVFEYRFRNASGRVASSTIVADTPRQARDVLRSQGVMIEQISMKAPTESSRLKTAGPRRNQLSSGVASQLKADSNETQNGPATSSQASLQGIARTGINLIGIGSNRFGSQVSWFTREMSTLLRVGTPMVEAIDLSILQANGRFRYILQDVRDQITRGHSLAYAVKRHENVFDPVLCELISVGEQSGALQSVLKQAADFRDRKDRIKDRVFSAMLYPALVLVLSIGVTIFLMTVVTPTLISSLQEMNHELPLPTVVLKYVSDLLISYGFSISIFGVVLLVAVSIFLRTPSGQIFWHRTQLKLPILGSLILKQNCSRLCMVAGTLIQSGVELVRALDIAEGAVSNMIVREVVTQARKRLASGTELGQAMANQGVFPAALIQVFSLGQNTGQLDELLFQIATDYDHQVATLTERMTTILEPILIVCLSAIVGFILLATLLPILETGNALSDY
jgi:type II secretory pathway component PulF